MAQDAQDTDEFDFAAWLADFGHGAANRQASSRLKELILACAESKKKGTLTLKIDVGADNGIAQLAASIKVTEPMPNLPGGSYYTTKSGALVTSDPKQLNIPLKSIETPPLKFPPPKKDN